MTWQPGNTAPKDGTVFTAVIQGHPRPVQCVYSPGSEQFCIAIFQANLYQGVWNDLYFENEWINDDTELTHWQPLPELPKDGHEHS